MLLKNKLETAFREIGGFFVTFILGANPAIRCNLICRTPAHKDFHYNLG
ncbi:hypothetical protein MCETHM1_02514 [Flavobacteriaceae bacterium]